MCGIVGYIGGRVAADVVLDGLSRLEYRGYDSAGIVVASAGKPELDVVKRAGKLQMLRDALAERTLAGAPLGGARAVGHTRWATHGKPTDTNAHPHLSEDGRLGLVHNGIIENYVALRDELKARGHDFRSETDTEVLVHLIEEQYAGDLPAAVRAALTRVRGAYALVVTHVDHPQVVAARATSPLVVGLGEGESWVASDVPALLPYTRRVVYVHDGELVVLGASGATLQRLDGTPVERAPETVEWDADAAEKGGHPHYMLKEMLEQPDVLRRTLGGRVTPDGLDADLQLGFDPSEVDRVVLVAAGTASYAATVGEALLERLGRVPAEVVVASEFRYQEPVVDARTLVVAVSQSGETIDTLEALREGRRRGARTLALLNVKGSSLAREADDVLYIHAGPEIGVASTKAYVAMLGAFTLLALRFGRARGTLDDAAAAAWVAGLDALPDAVALALSRRPQVAAVAERVANARDALFLGRGFDVATAYEGALKLKEISYLHAEAYPTGEMKHGPIALIDRDLPVVALATPSPTYEKTVSNLQEVRARDGWVVAIAGDGDTSIAEHADAVLYVPVVAEGLAPVVNVIPMQLLAYEVAVLLGRDVDQPRNLAKSVTVE
ncbi:MAG: glutamine--fructose-6-phosphate transaminase (isomerizing) [Trueperaceae bacterium]